MRGQSHGAGVRHGSIADEERRLAKMRGDILIAADDPVRLAKLKERFEIKSAYVKRMKREI
jgi:chromosome segregation and condensation protein ScpB